MSLSGAMRGESLRGKVNILHTLRGYSAYEIAVQNGFPGTAEEWLENLKGPPGPDGYTPRKGVDYYTDEDKAELLDHLKGYHDDDMHRLMDDLQTPLDQIQQLQRAVADLQYEPITITSFTVAQARAEMGESINGVDLNIYLSKVPASLGVNGTQIPAEELTELEYDLNMPDVLTATTAWKLTVTDERGATAAATRYTTFYNGVYYGAAAAPGSLDSGFILSLTKTLTDTRKRSVTVDAGAGAYIWYAVPERMGECTFFVGGFEGGFLLADTLAFTNSKGYTESYRVYRSVQANLGNTTVEVR